MKTTILIISLTAALFAEEFWVQVIAAKAEASLTPAFMQKLDHSGIEYKRSDTKEWHKIRMGSYPSRGDAIAALEPIRCKIASDAFVTGAEALKHEETEKKKETVQKRESGSPEGTCNCVYDKQTQRQREIGEILAYFKNTPQYRFPDSAQIVE